MAMQRFMRIMGSIAHLAEDLTTPEHSLNVPHENVQSNEDIWGMSLEAIYDEMIQIGPQKYTEGGRAAFIASFGTPSGSSTVIDAVVNA